MQEKTLFVIEKLIIGYWCLIGAWLLVIGYL